jgi:hypothetical protein
MAFLEAQRTNYLLRAPEQDYLKEPKLRSAIL